MNAVGIRNRHIFSDRFSYINYFNLSYGLKNMIFQSFIDFMNLFIYLNSNYLNTKLLWVHRSVPSKLIQRQTGGSQLTAQSAVN